MGAEQSHLSEKEAMRLELESKHLVRPEEAKKLYEGFMLKFGSTEVSKKDFVAFYHQVYQSMVRNPVIDKVISQLQAKDPSSGVITFEDTALAIGVAEHGSLENKLKWIFDLFDVDGQKSIDKMQVLELLRVSHRLLEEERANTNNSKLNLEAFFEDHKEQLSKEDFVHVCFRDIDVATAMAHALCSVLIDVKEQLMKNVN